MVKQPLEKGAELESKDNYSRTPLFQAAANGHEAVVKLLLERGAELEWKSNIGNMTPLFRAAANGHEAVVKLLLENGAKLEHKTITVVRRYCGLWQLGAIAFSQQVEDTLVTTPVMGTVGLVSGGACKFDANDQKAKSQWELSLAATAER